MNVFYIFTNNVAETLYNKISLNLPNKKIA